MSNFKMSSTLQELISISTMLSAVHHRNKNQHRVARWWKQLCVLRRNLDKLAKEIMTWEEGVSLMGEGKWSIAAQEAVVRRASFIMISVVPQCYLNFSSVVADGQFASLGLMLLATLARTRTLILPFMKEEIVEEAAKEGDAAASTNFSKHDEVDLGEVISREDLLSMKPKSSSKKRVSEDDDEELHSKQGRKQKVKGPKKWRVA